MKRSVLVLCCLLAGCVIGASGQRSIATYDLGLPIPAKNTPVKISTPLLVPNVSAPSWLDTPAMLYRLAYTEAPRYQAYAESRWVAPPPELLTLRLRTRIGAASSSGILTDPGSGNANFALRVELEEFSQIFDAPNSSRALIRLRATLLDRDGLLAQRAFDVWHDAAPGAEGGAKALAEASDQALEQLLAWVAAELEKTR